MSMITPVKCSLSFGWPKSSVSLWNSLFLKSPPELRGVSFFNSSRTPEASRLTDKPWEISDVVAMLEKWETAN